MKMKRYFAADSRQALRDLRDDQGPDAVILSNRRVQGGVEIIAALDYEDAMTNSSLGNPEKLSAQPSATRPSQNGDVERAGHAINNLEDGKFSDTQFSTSAPSHFNDGSLKKAGRR